MLTAAELKESLDALQSTKKLYQQYKAMVEYQCKIMDKACPYKIEHLLHNENSIGAKCFFADYPWYVIDMPIHYFHLDSFDWKKKILKACISDIYKRSGFVQPEYKTYEIWGGAKCEFITSICAQDDEEAKVLFFEYLIDHYLYSEQESYGLHLPGEDECIDAHMFPLNEEEEEE